MGKIRKCKLSWKPSESDLMVGYKLYWSNGNQVNYGSNFIKLGNKNEVNLPDVLIGIVPPGETIFLGISAVDKMGNESDIISLSEPYKFSAPPEPADLALATLDDFNITEPKQEAENQPQAIQTRNTQQSDKESQLNALRPAKKFVTTEGRIVDGFGMKPNKTLAE